MTCHNCQTVCKRFGKTPQGNQRFRCGTCAKTFSESQSRPLGEMRLSLDRALLCIQLIVEGNSTRSTERITGVHRDTILSLLVKAGQRCEQLLADTITGLRVRDVQADEMWGFVAMKEKANNREQQGIDTLGDAYTYVAIERNSKLILAWHLGRRNRQDTLKFIVKLRRATEGRFQLTTDGWPSYPECVERSGNGSWNLESCLVIGRTAGSNTVLGHYLRPGITFQRTSLVVRFWDREGWYVFSQLPFPLFYPAPAGRGVAPFANCGS